MTHKKQTAVEWLVEQIQSGKIEVIYSDKIHSIKCIPEIVKQAKELEKQQIIEACKEFDGFNTPQDWEQYYSETYGGNNGHI